MRGHFLRTYLVLMAFLALSVNHVAAKGSEHPEATIQFKRASASSGVTVVQIHCEADARYCRGRQLDNDTAVVVKKIRWRALGPILEKAAHSEELKAAAKPINDGDHYSWNLQYGEIALGGGYSNQSREPAPREIFILEAKVMELLE